ncbi:MAG: hypothetical protein ACXAD7_28695, partial [Candidatus Kariarchaeaceae archaeon]
EGNILPIILPLNGTVFQADVMAPILNATYAIYSNMSALNAFDQYSSNNLTNNIYLSNSTDGYYLNMTYFDNGTLEHADGKFLMSQGQNTSLVNITFNYQRIFSFNYTNNVSWSFTEGDKFYLGKNYYNTESLANDLGVLVESNLQITSILNNYNFTIDPHPNNQTFASDKIVQVLEEWDGEPTGVYFSVEDLYTDTPNPGNITMTASDNKFKGLLSENVQSGDYFHLYNATYSNGSSFSPLAPKVYNEFEVEITEIKKVNEVVMGPGYPVMQVFESVKANISKWNFTVMDYELWRSDEIVGMANNYIALNMYPLFSGDVDFSQYLGSNLSVNVQIANLSDWNDITIYPHPENQTWSNDMIIEMINSSGGSPTGDYFKTESVWYDFPKTGNVTLEVDRDYLMNDLSNYISNGDWFNLYEIDYPDDDDSSGGPLFMVYPAGLTLADFKTTWSNATIRQMDMSVGYFYSNGTARLIDKKDNGVMNIFVNMTTGIWESSRMVTNGTIHDVMFMKESDIISGAMPTTALTSLTGIDGTVLYNATENYEGDVN